MNINEKIELVIKNMPQLFDEYFTIEDIRNIKKYKYLRKDLVHAAGCTEQFCATKLSVEHLVAEAYIFGVKVPRSLKYILRNANLIP